jgi:hypothetical protein
MTVKEILQLIALAGVYDARKVPNDQIRLAAMAGEWAESCPAVPEGSPP